MTTINNSELEKMAEQLHLWYLEAIQKLDPENYNPKAQKPYAELNEQQKDIDRYIAEKTLALIHTETQRAVEEARKDELNNLLHDPKIKWSDRFYAHKINHRLATINQSKKEES